MRETADLPTGERRYQYASCVWCYRKIRQAGGLAIFCHPYWVTHRAYNVPEWLIERHLADRPFDAFELIGGFHMHEAESNVLQVARYHEQRTRDPARPIPVVGVSDAHGCERGELFGWYYTIVLAASPSLPDVIDAVRGCYSVAVEALPGAPPRAHGPMRLVKFAQFLLREVFGARDELCAEEGRLMLSHVAGDPAAARQLAGLKGRTAAMMDRLWGR